MSDELNQKVTAGDSERNMAFKVGDEQYAIPLLTVREVIAIPEVTPVPFTPKHFLGIMNIRGQVISVVDLRIKLGVPDKRNSETSVIILDHEDITVGVVVDSIDRVLVVSSEDRIPTPEIESKVNNKYIEGVFRVEDKLVLLIDILSLLDSKDLQTIRSQRKAA